MTGARYAALGIYDQAGRVERFVHHGLDAGTVERIGVLPQGRGLLGEVIVGNGPIRLADLTTDPRSAGFPEHHPPMYRFLGVPVRRGERRFGNLYLTEKPACFDAQDDGGSWSWRHSLPQLWSRCGWPPPRSEPGPTGIC